MLISDRSEQLESSSDGGFGCSACGKSIMSQCHLFSVFPAYLLHPTAP
jgi:hypothetical protein